MSTAMTRMTPRKAGTAPAGKYELHYWPTIQGRGEFVRLALEYAAVPYVDVARLPEDAGGGEVALYKSLDRAHPRTIPFAPPYLKAGDLVIAQTANILLFIGRRHGLAPADEAVETARIGLGRTKPGETSEQSVLRADAPVDSGI